MNLSNECACLMDGVREKRPLVHHITNYVTVNDCANVVLAAGASPVMADAIEEVAEFAAMASALVLNIGTLNRRAVESMLAAGRSANAAGVPVVLDPVGAGATAYRSATAARLLGELRIAAVRGNISEIRSLLGLSAHTKGVDAAGVDADIDAGKVAADLAAGLGCVVAVTGVRDAISDGARTLFVDNGVAAMAGVSGTGCMCSSLVGVFAGSRPESTLIATAAALVCMGVAGELAFERVGRSGSGSYRSAIIDAVSLMDGEALARKGRILEAVH